MKVITLLLLCSLWTHQIFAQNDTILFENFEEDISGVIFELPPNGDDATWLNFNNDGLPDGSGNDRSNVWFQNIGFATVDAENTVMLSNSWTNLPDQSVDRYLILPPIFIADQNAILYWKSAPRQTPRFLDGYKVAAQIGSNIETNFNISLAEFAEFTGFIAGGDSSNFNDYTFSEGYVHGADGTYVEDGGDSTRLLGILRPDSVSLAQFAGQTIYIAFVHNSTDDNLISIDDILITGTNETSIKKVNQTFDVRLFPNPAKDFVQLSIDLPSTTYLGISLYSLDGKFIKSIPSGILIKGAHQFNIDISDLSTGVYNVVFQTSKERFGKQIIKE